jgi:hypothetical protein
MPKSGSSSLLEISYIIIIETYFEIEGNINILEIPNRNEWNRKEKAKYPTLIKKPITIIREKSDKSRE